MDTAEIINTSALLFAVIDPLGSVPVFLAVTAKHSPEDRTRIAVRAALIAGGVLLFFLVAGQLLLEAIQVPLDAFQISGGIILFLFALTMIFGESKPEQEMGMIRSHQETATFPLAMPSIASPGAIMAVILLTDNHRFSISHQLVTAGIVVGIVGLTLVLLLGSRWIHRMIGDGGTGIVSRVMGMLLASVAANNVLSGLRSYFSVG